MMTKRPTGDRRGLYAAAVAVVLLLGGGIVVTYALMHRVSPPPEVPLSAATSAATDSSPTSPEAVGPVAPGRSGTAAPTAAAGARFMARSVPTELDIPSIGVHSSLLQLGLNPDGTVAVPGKPLLAGWFRDGPSPGEIGPAVILGHVDTKETGPAVFYRLGALHRGDHVSVRRSDGTVARFTVQSIKSYLKAAFPTLEVYGNTSGAELRLITCSVFDRKTRHYIGNTVAYATLDG